MSTAWIRADWPAPHTVIAGTTLRGGGVSRRQYESLNLGAHVGDDELAVAENRQRFGRLCGLPRQPAWLRQVHGVSVLTDPLPDSPQEADAIVSRRHATVCAVLTADCLPVLLAAADGSEVAAAGQDQRISCCDNIRGRHVVKAIHRAIEHE